jgi:hypothetical protein
MIIGLVGKKQSGKDTAYSLIKERYPHAERRAFADKLKQSAAALLNVSLDDLEQWKVDPEISIGLVWSDQDYHEALVTGREFLQRYGTEAHRDIFGEAFWLQQCLPAGEFTADKLIVITDCRFLNEAAWIHGLGGLIFKISRGTLESGDVHPSEVELEQIVPDYHIQNDGTMDEFRNELYLRLKEIEEDGIKL